MISVYIAADHAGFTAKNMIVKFLRSSGFTVHDLGTNSGDSVDYPDFALKVAESVAANRGSCGILICGTGIGMSIAANKQTGIRAANCHTVEAARLSRKHNNANVLCLGARLVPISELRKIALEWLNTDFEAGRHQKRIDIISDFEEK